MSKEVGGRIKEKRLQFGCSQAKIGELVGVSPAWIYGLDVNEDFKVELTGEECRIVWGENYYVML